MPTDSFLIRPAVEADRPGVLHCLAAAFEPFRAAYTVQAFADTVLDPIGFGDRLRTMHLLVAVSKSEIAGTISGSRNGKEGHLRGMAVLPELKGTGLATRLLSIMEIWLREQGCNRITLDTTLPLKAAIRFYEKAGYLYSGRTVDFFGMPLLEYAKEL